MVAAERVVWARNPAAVGSGSWQQAAGAADGCLGVACQALRVVFGVEVERSWVTFLDWHLGHF